MEPESTLTVPEVVIVPPFSPEPAVMDVTVPELPGTLTKLLPSPLNDPVKEPEVLPPRDERVDEPRYMVEPLKYKSLHRKSVDPRSYNSVVEGTM
jgi:hypothetical protein